MRRAIDLHCHPSYNVIRTENVLIKNGGYHYGRKQYTKESINSRSR